MDWIKKVCLLLLINLSFTLGVFGQLNEDSTHTNDFWTGISFKYKLNKKIAFNLGQQARITDNLNLIQSNLFDFAVKYKWNKYLSTRVQYRYTIRNNERHTNRYILDANAKWNIKPAKIEFSYRMRLQHSMVTFTKEPSSFLRNRIRVRYTLSKKIKPFISYENFYKFNDSQEFRGNRYTAGLIVRLNKQLEATIWYKYDQEINTKNPMTRNIVGVFMSYTF